MGHRDCPWPHGRDFNPPKGTCRWCAGEIRRADGRLDGRRRWHPECVHDFKMRTMAEYASWHLAGERGPQCASCGVLHGIMVPCRLPGGRVQQRRSTHELKRRGVVVEMLLQDRWAAPWRPPEQPDDEALGPVPWEWPHETREQEIARWERHRGDDAAYRPNEAQGRAVIWILCRQVRTELDHVVPLWQVAHLPDDERFWYFGPENLQLLCIPCHREKTAAEASRRAAANRANVGDVAAQGALELDGSHHPTGQQRSAPRAKTGRTGAGGLTHPRLKRKVSGKVVPR